MKATITGEFETRRAAEIAVEHVVQECGVPRADVSIRPAGDENTSGERPAGADAKASPSPEHGGKLDGPIEVSVGLHGDDATKVADALKAAGATSVRTK